MNKKSNCDWSGRLCWVRGCGGGDFTSSASAGGKDADTRSVAWLSGEAADSMLLEEETDTSPTDSGNPPGKLSFFVTASHQTGLDSRSMTRRSVYCEG